MNQQQEINEAIYAINEALPLLEKAHSELKTAGGLGVWDMLGGGFFSGVMKHSKINEAKKTLEEAKKALMRVKDELDDIDNFQELSIQIDGFLSFADYFFDNFIADWMVQSKINEARSKVFDAILELKDIKEQLQRI